MVGDILYVIGVIYYTYESYVNVFAKFKCNGFALFNYFLFVVFYRLLIFELILLILLLLDLLNFCYALICLDYYFYCLNWIVFANSISAFSVFFINY